MTTPGATARPRIVLVAAFARDRTIGVAGGIPWKHAEDLASFKRSTMGTTLVMGRRTYDSIGRPLPGRETIVVTRAPAAFAAAHPGTFAAGSLGEAIALAASRGAQTVSVAGGGEVYALALPIADEMLLTEIPVDGGGDTFFPAWDEAEWDEASREAVGTAVKVRYVRRRAGTADAAVRSR